MIIKNDNLITGRPLMRIVNGITNKADYGVVIK